MAERPKDGEVVFATYGSGIFGTVHDSESEARGFLFENERIIPLTVGHCPLARLEEWRAAAPEGQARGVGIDAVFHACTVRLTMSGPGEKLVDVKVYTDGDDIYAPLFPDFKDTSHGANNTYRLICAKVDVGDRDIVSSCLTAALALAERVEAEMGKGGGE